MSGFGEGSANVASGRRGFVGWLFSSRRACNRFVLPLLIGSGCSLSADDFEPRLVRDETLPATPAAPPDAGSSSAVTGCANELCGEACDASCGRLVACTGDTDCAPSQQCIERQCVDRASCTDGRANQDEADVDCGGSCGLRCAVGRACRSSQDCAQGLTCPSASRVCSIEDCPDAGSGCDAGCASCAEESPCTDPAGCENVSCEADGTCPPPSCDDGVSNQGEADVDCAGPCDRRCQPGDACSSAADCEGGPCAPGGCAAGVATCCQAASCIDETRNGTETDVDCGGPDQACGRCDAGRGCRVDGDCASNACEGSRCCGGSRGDCTRCAERLSGNIDCDDAPAGGEADCGEFLACLARNASVCDVRFAPGCSNDPGGACNHNTYGGDGGLGLMHVTRLLDEAGCEQ